MPCAVFSALLCSDKSKKYCRRLMSCLSEPLVLVFAREFLSSNTNSSLVKCAQEDIISSNHELFARLCLKSPIDQSIPYMSGLFLYASSLVLEVFSLENPLESAFFSKTENARQCAVLFALLKIDQKLVIIDGSMSCVSAIFFGPVRLTRKEMSL